MPVNLRRPFLSVPSDPAHDFVMALPTILPLHSGSVSLPITGLALGALVGRSGEPTLAVDLGSAASLSRGHCAELRYRQRVC